jgi:hypothetical protein
LPEIGVTSLSPAAERPGNRDQGLDPIPDAAGRVRCRSFCFLEREEERWMVFLVTYPDESGRWRGHFSFRPSSAPPEKAEIRTASLFVEDDETQIDLRARGLGRPLLLALLDSALETRARRRQRSADPRRWFQQHLTQSARRGPGLVVDTPDLSDPELHSLYDSYRLDQVSHLIALIDPDDFRILVEQTLDGKSIDFRARDRFQLAMIVVQKLERHLVLPPFEIWVRDYLAHREAYQVYTHALHRGEELP